MDLITNTKEKRYNISVYRENKKKIMEGTLNSV